MLHGRRRAPHDRPSAPGACHSTLSSWGCLASESQRGTWTSSNRIGGAIDWSFSNFEFHVSIRDSILLRGSSATWHAEGAALGWKVPRRDYAARRLPEACQPVTTHDQKPARSPTLTAPPRATGGPRSPSEGCNCPPATVSRRRAPQTGCAVPRAAPRQPANMRESLVCKKHTPPRAPRPSGRRARPGASARSTRAEIPPQGPCRGGPRLGPGNRSPAPRRCAPGPPARDREPLVCRGTPSPTHLPPASPLAPAAWPPPRRPHEPAGRAGRGEKNLRSGCRRGPGRGAAGARGGHGAGGDSEVTPLPQTLATERTRFTLTSNVTVKQAFFPSLRFRARWGGDPTLPSGRAGGGRLNCIAAGVGIARRVGGLRPSDASVHAVPRGG